MKISMNLKTISVKPTEAEPAPEPKKRPREEEEEVPRRRPSIFLDFSMKMIDFS